MARLFEFEGKEQLKNAGIPIPQGIVVSTPEEAREAATKIGKPVAVKAQVWVGGRGKAGGIKLADTPEEAEKVADQDPFVIEDLLDNRWLKEWNVV